MDSIVGLIEFLIGAVLAMVAVAVALMLVVSRMPPENPLRQVLNLLITRIGATAAAGALAIPIEPIPGLDLLYDIGAPVIILYYWYRFFRRIGPIWSRRPARELPPR